MTDFSTLSLLIPDIKIISQSEYRLIAFSEKYSLVYHEWFESSQEIDDEMFKTLGHEIFEILEQIRPAYFIPNDRKRKVSISSEINEFLVVNFQPYFHHPTMKKVALVSNEMLSIQSQAEVTMEEVKNTEPQTGAEFQFFINVESATKWLGIRE